MTTKVFNIPKQQVVEAYKLVKANPGSAGIDQQSLIDFEENLQDNLYKIWNRLSSSPMTSCRTVHESLDSYGF